MEFAGRLTSAQEAQILLDSEAQQVLNKYLDEQQQADLFIKGQTLSNLYAQGNQNNIIRRRVTSIDIERFPMLYERFKAGHADVLEGTPLSEVPWIGRSMVEELNYLHIRTLEQLANLDDAVCTRFVGYHELKRRAQAFVEKAQSDAPLLALEEENKNLKESMAALEQMVKQQTEAMAKLQEQVEKSGKK